MLDGPEKNEGGRPTDGLGGHLENETLPPGRAACVSILPGIGGIGGYSIPAEQLEFRSITPEGRRILSLPGQVVTTNHDDNVRWMVFRGIIFVGRDCPVACEMCVSV